MTHRANRVINTSNPNQFPSNDPARFKIAAGSTSTVPQDVPMGVTILGQPISIFRSFGRYATGRIIWAEDFESPGAVQNWYSNDGIRWRACRSALRSRTGRYSLRLIMQGSLCDTHRTVTLDSATTTRIGVEHWFAFSDNLIAATGTVFTGLAIERWNGSAYDEYQCLYNPPTGNYTVNFDNNPSTVIRPQKLAPYNPGGLQAAMPISQCWHHEKLVVDISAKTFVKLLIDNETYDLSATSLQVSGIKTPTVNARDPNIIILEWHIQATNNVTAVTPGQLYIDDIVVTDET